MENIETGMSPDLAVWVIAEWSDGSGRGREAERSYVHQWHPMKIHLPVRERVVWIIARSNLMGQVEVDSQDFATGLVDGECCASMLDI